MRILGDIAGIASMGLALVAVAYFVPESEATRPMLFFVFVVLAVCGEYYWRREPPQSSRDWLLLFAVALVASLIVAAGGTVVAHIQGQRGEPLELLHASGTFAIVMMIAVPVLLVALGGAARAIVVEKAANDG